MRRAHCKDEEEEAVVFARLEDDRKKAEAAQDKASACLLEEDRRRAKEAHRRAMEQEEGRVSREREGRGRERHESESSSVTESARPDLAQLLRLYEDKWDALRNSGVAVEQLSFYDIPWPVLEESRTSGGSKRELVLAFVCP